MRFNDRSMSERGYCCDCGEWRPLVDDNQECCARCLEEREQASLEAAADMAVIHALARWSETGSGRP